VTDRVALYLALFILALVGLDFLVTGGDTLVFLAKKFFDMLTWFEFWR
jgi:hypothetical protein